ncbi:wings apart-like protein homolog [Ambystoma mexicanum]|uniref:wings apart-like protein homolog n=1 Tax=Ambystoma mexicanum TaxID=8296 RepID=UPI0037E88DB4
MTSRFGKTYSRKGGDGSSKFDEVFSSKRTTHSTKWGETTFMAKVGQKRPIFKPVPEIPKKPKVDVEITEDPFGFDSDEESAPVSSSKILPQAKVGSHTPAEISESAKPENSQVLEANDHVSQVFNSGTTVSCKFISFDSTLHGINEAKADPILQDGESKVNSVQCSATDETHRLNEDSEQNNVSLYVNTEDGKEKFQVETAVVEHNFDVQTQDDSWDSRIGKKSQSSSGIFQTHDSLSSAIYDWDEQDQEDNRAMENQADFNNEHLELTNQGDGLTNPNDTDDLQEAFDEDDLQSVVKLSNCRTYCRPNKGRHSQGTADFDKVMDGTSHSVAKADVSDKKLNTTKKCAPSSTVRTSGRTRDYTVLHPSCLSVCNVTIQDTLDRSIEDLTATTDLGEAGRLRKKADLATTKTYNRFRPSNRKSKKDAKLEFFGFEDQDEGGGGGEGSKIPGRSSYRIKYFGFEELSDSDEDDEEEWHVAEMKTKKKERMAKLPPVPLPLRSEAYANLHSRQSTTNIELMDFNDDPYELPEELKKAKPGEKSRESARKIFNAPKRSPTKAVYNARHWNHPESEELPAPPVFLLQNAHIKPPSNEVSSKDDGLFKTPAPPPKVTKTVTIPTQPYQDIVTALKCRKEHKELYTVVQHVKHFNDVVEFGENQEFTDDIEYLLSGLKSTQPINTRCLSVISLATKCAMPSFRMHLRANGMVAMVFKTLDDTHHHQNLALCTASLMYILSRDRLNMDLDRASLDLMIKLLEMDIDPDAMQLNEKDMNKIKEKIRKLCETVHNKHLDLENITTGHLAMETLLSLTSKRAGDWFKEELRLLGGLDHIVDKVKECVDHLSIHESEDKLVASLWGAERCLRVLESVTVHNPENQSYLIAYKDSQLIAASAKALQHCEQFVQRYNRAEDSICVVDNTSLSLCTVTNHVGKAVEDCMRAIIGVLLNLTNDNEWGSTKTGEQENLISTALSCVLQVPQYLPQEQRFDIRVLGLGLLINLVEYSARNRHCLVTMETTCSYDSLCGEERVRVVGQLNAVHALVQLFLERERAALLAESQTDELIKEVPAAQHDKSGEWQESGGEIQWVASEKSSTNEEPEKKEEEEEELDLNKALQHAGKHMEDCIVASYTALLLGCLCQESPMNVTTVREYLPEGDFSIMTEMLQKFLSFMNLTCAVGTTGQKSISRVIEYLENC